MKPYKKSLKLNPHILFSNRRAQSQMFETIAVLIIFFFLIAFGVGFYFFVSKVQLQKDLEKQEQLRMVELVEKASRLPELDCIKVEVKELQCFEKQKIEAFAVGTAQDQSFASDYFDVFGFASLTIRQIYPTPIDTDKFKNLTFYKNLPIDITNLNTDQLKTKLKSLNQRKASIPVVLKDPTENTAKGGENHFAVLDVTLYQKPGN